MLYFICLQFKCLAVACGAEGRKKTRASESASERQLREDADQDPLARSADVGEQDSEHVQ